MEKDLQRIVSEKAELLEDNQRMAKLLANSEGDRKEVADLLERLSEERKKFQRQCELFKDQGESVVYTYLVCMVWGYAVIPHSCRENSTTENL